MQLLRNMSHQETEVQRKGIHILIDWANTQDHWVRAIVAEVIAVRRELPEQSINRAYALLLAEKGLSHEPPPNIPQLSVGEAPADSADELSLVRVGNLSGVNALAKGQEIDFNPKLTVLFGENAAGKTGYVRVLKRVASVRAAQPILGNIRASAAEKPHAKITYIQSGATSELDWNDESGVPPFTRMSVFDSGAVTLHVDEDLTYIFTPSELALFLYAHRAIDAAKARLEHEKNDAQAKSTNPYLARFRRDQVVYPKIETLGPSTSLAELDALAEVTDQEEASLVGLRDRVEALRPRSVDDRLHVANSDRELYSSVRNAAETVASFPWDAYNGAIAEIVEAQDRYNTASRTAFEGERIPAIFGEAWNEFIGAGEKYLREIGAHEHPGENDHCPYCQQELGAKAVALLSKYRDYSNNEPKKTLDSKIGSAKRLAAPLATLPLAELKATCERRKSSFNDPSTVPPLLPKLIDFLGRLERTCTDVSARRHVSDGSSLVDASKELVRESSDAMTKAEAAIVDLRKQSEDRKKELETESAKLSLLESRLVLKAGLPEIRTYVERAQWAARATPLIARATSILRLLTEQSKLASKELLDNDFERLFEAECTALRAPKVQLDFAGRRGQAARKKTLVPDHHLSEILSEGEQKVIALADFLAEAGLHRTTAPIIFDDPVNSLDYKRLQYVVDRIVELSKARQVIVFTHNIWFATELLARFEKTTNDCNYYGVAEVEGSTGIVTRGSHPRWDTVKHLHGRINQLIQGASKVSGESQTALVESAYGEIRSWCEVVVEQELLAGVTQRYQPNVAMTKLSQIKPEKFAAARDVIFPLFEKTCRIMTAHSQPLETLSVRPTLDDLNRDWAAAQRARDTYIA